MWQCAGPLQVSSLSSPAGWRFNSAGACTKMPQTVLCRGVGVQSLPVEEKDGELAGLRVIPGCVGFRVGGRGRSGGSLLGPEGRMPQGGRQQREQVHCGTRSTAGSWRTTSGAAAARRLRAPAPWWHVLYTTPPPPPLLPPAHLPTYRLLPCAGFVWVWPGWETPGELPSFAMPPQGFTIHAQLEMEVPVEHGLLVRFIYWEHCWGLSVVGGLSREHGMVRGWVCCTGSRQPRFAFVT